MAVPMLYRNQGRIFPLKGIEVGPIYRPNPTCWLFSCISPLKRMLRQRQKTRRRILRHVTARPHTSTHRISWVSIGI